MGFENCTQLPFVICVPAERLVQWHELRPPLFLELMLRKKRGKEVVSKKPYCPDTFGGNKASCSHKFPLVLLGMEGALSH